MHNSSNPRNNGFGLRLSGDSPDLDRQVRFVVDANPKRPGCKAWHRFEAYFKEPPLTVRQMLAAGAKPEDVRWDLAHRFITLDPVPN